MRLFGQGRGSLNKICATVSGLVCSYSSQKDLISQQEGCLKGGRPLLCLHGDVPKASTERVSFIDTTAHQVLLFCFFCFSNKKGSSGDRGGKGDKGSEGLQGPQVSDPETSGPMTRNL